MPFLLKRFGRNVATEVQRWQYFLRCQGIAEVGAVDGGFGEKTENATKLFQQQRGLRVTGALDAPTLQEAHNLGYVMVGEDHYTPSGAVWPPRPGNLTSPNASWRTDHLGCFQFTQPPRAQRGDPDGIIIGKSCDGSVPNWEMAEIVRARIPQLAGIPSYGGLSQGTVRLHRLAAPRFVQLFGAWEQANLMHLVIFFGGAFNARYARDKSPSSQGHGRKSSRDVAALSNHAYGSAIDINVADNDWNKPPAPMGAKGCVRELVPIANKLGFFWGGHYQDRPDGMHFELARL